MITLKPSRTFALAAFGLLTLALVALGLFGILTWFLFHPIEGSPELPGQLVQALQVVAGCLATVATAGAGSMAARDYASRGLTSSQGLEVAASRWSAAAPPPQAFRPGPGPAAPPAGPTPGPAEDAEDLAGP